MVVKVVTGDTIEDVDGSTVERRIIMNKIYFTITGTHHYFGDEFIEPGMEVKLMKEPDNEHDTEAIKVELEGLGKIGYVANTPYTALGESMSAGRIYDRIDDVAYGIVKYVLPQGILCELSEEVSYDK